MFFCTNVILKWARGRRVAEGCFVAPTHSVPRLNYIRAPENGDNFFACLISILHSKLVENFTRANPHFARESDAIMEAAVKGGVRKGVAFYSGFRAFSLRVAVVGRVGVLNAMGFGLTEETLFGAEFISFTLGHNGEGGFNGLTSRDFAWEFVYPEIREPIKNSTEKGT